MRSLRLAVLALASLALLFGGRAQAQRLPTNAAWSARSAIPASAQTERSALVEPVPVRSAGNSSAQGATGRLLHLVGGAVVGSWVGYVTSQVMRSDWDKDNNSEFAEYRRTSAGIGAGIGALAGLLVSTKSPSISVPRLAREDRGMNADITREDIVRSGSASVFDVVQSLRPSWLRVRGVSKLGEIGTVHGSPGNEVVIPGEIAIKVYMDGARMGGVESLRQLPAVSAGAIQHFDAAAATLRFGSGHEHGAIVVTSVST